MNSLGARLLQSPAANAGTPPRGGSMAQRAAGWHGPDPSLALMLVLAFAGCASLMRQAKGRPSAPSVATDLAAMGGGDLGLETDTSPGQPGPVLVAVVATALCAIVCQYVSEKLAVNLVAQAFQGMKELGLSLERRSARAWICPGRLSLRNCTVRNPDGYRGDCLLLARGVVADVGVWRLLRSLGNDVHVKRLCIEDVDVALEETGIPAGGRCNLEVLLDALSNQQKSESRTKRRFHVGEVVIKNVGVQAGGCRTRLADLRFDDFTAATGADSGSGAAGALVAAVARAALESRAQAASASEGRAAAT
uniref:Uncharacterized protein n=1 Tax=Alexandrium catenella TaxID=2925 RepID=A0A7S1SF73_ALECA